MANIEGLTALQKRFAAISDSRTLLRALAPLVVSEQRLMAPKRAGFLQNSIQIGAVTDSSLETFTRIAYARAQEYGSKPHVIRAKPGRSSRNPKYAHSLAWGGARRLSGSLRSGASPTNFAMSVNHPGNRPHPFMMPGAKRALERAGLANRLYVAWNGAA